MRIGTTDQLPSCNWRARYSLGTGEQLHIKGTFPTEEEAQRAIPQAHARATLGIAPQPHERRTRPFREFAEQVLSAREYRPRTRSNHRSLLNGILSEFEKRDLGSITRFEITMWWNQKSTHLVNRRNALFLMRVIFRAAIKHKYISDDPTGVIEPTDVAKARPTHTVAEYRRVLAHISPEFAPAITVMFSAHLRLGELLALNVDDYDSATGVIHVTKAADLNGQLGESKTGQHRSLVVLTAGREALSAILVSRQTGPMFLGASGRRLPRLALRKAWIAACDRAGVLDFHLHDLRHVGRTEIARSGASLADLKKRSGHSSTAALVGYLHSDDTRDAEIARAADERLSA